MSPQRRYCPEPDRTRSHGSTTSPLSGWPSSRWVVRRGVWRWPLPTPRKGCSSGEPSARSRPSSTSAPTCSCPSSRRSRRPTTPGWAAAADDAELRIVAPLAKAYCSDAYFAVAADNIQVHGGIGFTWEHDAHLYFKRAKVGPVDVRRPGSVASRAGRSYRSLGRSRFRRAWIRCRIGMRSTQEQDYSGVGGLLEEALKGRDLELTRRAAHDVAVAVEEHPVGEATRTERAERQTDRCRRRSQERSSLPGRARCSAGSWAVPSSSTSPRRRCRLPRLRRQSPTTLELGEPRLGSGGTSGPGTPPLSPCRRGALRRCPQRSSHR